MIKYTHKYTQKKITENKFYNGKYDIIFPHIQNTDSYVNDFHRRFKRLKDDFYNDDNILFILTCYDKKYEKNIIEFVDKILLLKQNIHFYVINGISENYELDKKYEKYITSEYIQKTDNVNDDYIYKIYNPALIDKLRTFMENIKIDFLN